MILSLKKKLLKHKDMGIVKICTMFCEKQTLFLSIRH